MMFDLVTHGPDTYVGSGPKYPWGGLYGGQIVAQALRAATLSVERGFVPHSIRAYFIRRGDHTEPIRYEVDRIRNGRSFVTRRVVARQAVGAILNAECSFQRPEESPDLQTVHAPDVPGPESFANSSFSEHFDRRSLPSSALPPTRDGAGRTAAWMRVLAPLGDADPSSRVHEAWVAFLSDDVPTGTAFETLNEHGVAAGDGWMSVSLDHTVWFHRPVAADQWHLYDTTCHHVGGSRALTIGHVYAADGTHVASVAQELLLRAPRQSAD